MIRFRIEIARKNGSPFEVVVEYPYIDHAQCDFKKPPRIVAMGYGITEWEYEQGKGDYNSGESASPSESVCSKRD